ncbi:hypothetical protein DM860_011311 [Cuscuta australis]|uniref:Pentacotripeptide-repeat region of PRORP domain-containing protein n=1 Tax=Cuscuta australis TaxID=267555 RepID=A0A328DU45_9ASTE|nr:hypothetical protein DM860_011311 [Cuscuta australis]
MFVPVDLLLTELSRSAQTISTTKSLHAIILKAPHLCNDPFYATRIVRFYALNDDPVSARQLFDGTPRRSIFLWNSVIRALARTRRFSGAVALFRDLMRSPTAPDNFTFACVLRACSDRLDLRGLRAAHGGAVVAGLGSDSICSSQLVSAYSKLGRLDAAVKVFDMISEPDLVHWNSMISGHGCIGDWENGLRVFIKMQRMGKQPDAYTLVGLATCLDSPDLLRICENVHGFCIKSGFDSNPHVSSLLVSIYSRCKSTSSACRVFDSLPDPDLITWSAMICSLSQSGEMRKALGFFREMMSTKRGSGNADSPLLAAVLSAAAQSASVQFGREIHGHAFRRGCHLDVSVSSGLIDMYSKCGFLNSGVKVFETAPSKNITSYNSMISSLGLHGNAREALRLFQEVLENRGVLEPDEATFSAVLSACCHAGLVSEGKKCFATMREGFGIRAKTQHYVCMVKLLGMGGELDEAHELVRGIEAPVDCGVWGALLSCCEAHGDYRLGRIVAKHVLESEQEKSSYGVMVCNMYARDGRWEEVKKLRVDGEAARGKVPGKSWITNTKTL